MSKKRYVYTLTDPRDNQVRYVGITTSPAARISNHCMRPQNATADWVEELNQAGLIPRMEVVESTTLPAEDARAIENDWILYYRFVKGANLLNQLYEWTQPGASTVIEWPPAKIFVRPAMTRAQVDERIQRRLQDIEDAQRDIATMRGYLADMGEGDSLDVEHGIELL